MRDTKIDETEFQKIGRRIRLMRLRRDMSQAELADRLGIAQTGLSSMEHGKTRTTLRRLIQIRDVLGCSMSDFFEDEKPAESDISIDEVVEAMRIVKKIRLAEAREN